MSRPAIATALLVAAAVALAIGLFVAGAMWRARVTGVPGHAAAPAAASPRAR